MSLRDRLCDRLIECHDDIERGSGLVDTLRAYEALVSDLSALTEEVSGP